MRWQSVSAAATGAIFFAILIALGPVAHAGLIHWNAYIDGLQETPPVATPATGFATGTFDTDTRELTWNITYQDLIGTITAAHFHGNAPPGTPAGVKLGIGALPSPMIGAGTVAVADVQPFLDGQWYINIHSTFKTGGEIRGQVTMIPEPATWIGALTGLIGLAVCKCRRKRK